MRYIHGCDTHTHTALLLGVHATLSGRRLLARHSGPGPLVAWRGGACAEVDHGAVRGR